MTKIQEQLAALDRKVDALLNKSLPRPAEVRPSPKPVFYQPVHAHGPVHAHDPVQDSRRQHDQQKTRQLFPATCADCKKDCELPFKPSGDRPVYCKECFSRRKSGPHSKVSVENKPKETLPVPVATAPAVVPVPPPPAKEKKKPAAAKKPAAKKKPVARKKTGK
ncbi:MAG: hypothetical protein HQL18_00775 [Candidatus Omnitrophica bacterium]|nr:hypothetical protein [Candidatus Omnitrophota bacterium]